MAGAFRTLPGRPHTESCAVLTLLNGSPVSEKERQDAELWYLRVASEHEAQLDAEQFAQQYPTYAELVAKYGKVEAAPKHITSHALKDRLCSLQLRYGDRTLTKRVPLNMSVRAAKTMFARLFGIQDDIQLRLVTEQGRSEVLEDTLKDFQFYEVPLDGGAFLIETG
jgi:ferric-dicitrate binding protein FerR (iron transport regulator)